MRNESSDDGLTLRGTIEGDLPILFEHQRDPEACHMAAFAPRDWNEFTEHWTRILNDSAVSKKTILVDGRVAGYIVTFDRSGTREIGYWVGREFWGRGVATRALSEFLEGVPERPLRAIVAKHNAGSIRVLEKCGFEVLGPLPEASDSRGPVVEELLLELCAHPRPARFTARTEIIGASARCVRIDADGQQLRYVDVLDLWPSNQVFRTLFISILAGSEFRAFRWETPPLANGNRGRLFEFVMLDAPELDTPGDATAFVDHFRSPGPGDGVVAFPNLGGDALLVVPEPRGPATSYGHLAAFTRGAPAEQNHALWSAVGRSMKQRLGDRPTWLSTAGGGVPWFHVRLDARPKYYGHRPYAMERVD